MSHFTTPQAPPLQLATIHHQCFFPPSTWDWVQGDSSSVETASSPMRAAHEEKAQDEESELPLTAPSADRRRGSTSTLMVPSSTAHTQHAEMMFVREYDRGRELRTTPIQGAEVVAMLTSLVGENQVLSKRKVRCLSWTTSMQWQDGPGG
jgi:hypothetical protein